MDTNVNNTKPKKDGILPISPNESGHNALISVGGGLKIFWTGAVLVYAMLAPVHSTFKYLQGLLVFCLSALVGPLLPVILTVFVVKFQPPHTIKLLLILNNDKEVSPLNKITYVKNDKTNAIYQTSPAASINDSPLLKVLSLIILPPLLLVGCVPLIIYYYSSTINISITWDLLTLTTGLMVLFITISATLAINAITAYEQGLPRPILTSFKILAPNLVQIFGFSIACTFSIPIALNIAHLLWAYVDQVIVYRYDNILGLTSYLSVRCLDKCTYIYLIGSIIYAMRVIIHKLALPNTK